MIGARGDRGYVYQELLVAVAILGFAMTAVFPLFILGGRRSATALDLRVSTVLAEAQVEALRSRSGTALFSAGDVVRVGSADFVRSWVVRRSDPYAPLTTVTVSVQPRRGSALGRTTSLSVRFAEVVP
jgi:type II secretory pathway pseudopilin PulG